MKSRLKQAETELQKINEVLLVRIEEVSSLQIKIAH